MSGPDGDDDLLALSIVEPDAFVAARNARAKELRAAKEKDRAAVVAKLAKPTWTAWALNVLAREHPDEIGAWLDAGDALDAALAGALSGDREGLRDAQRGERAALAHVVDRAGEVLTGAGRRADDQAIQRLTGTLRAAVTDPDVRDRLVRGVLADDVEAPAFGFGVAADDNVVSMASARSSRAARNRGSAPRVPGTSTSAARSRATGRSGSPGRGATSGTEDDAGADAARIEREESEAREAAARAEARRRAEEERAAELARLEAEVDRRQADLDRLRAAADEAEAAARVARDAAEVADQALADARSAVADLPPIDPE